MFHCLTIYRIFIDNNIVINKLGVTNMKKLLLLSSVIIVILSGCMTDDSVNDPYITIDELKLELATNKEELSQLRLVVHDQDSIATILNSDIFFWKSETDKFENLYKRSLKDKGNILKTMQTRIDNMLYQMNQDNEEFVMMESKYIDSVTVLMDRIFSLEETIHDTNMMFDTLDKHYYINAKEDVDKTEETVLLQLAVQEKLYNACKDGRFENIGECTCNDILGEAKHLQGMLDIIIKVKSPK